MGEQFSHFSQHSAPFCQGVSLVLMKGDQDSHMIIPNDMVWVYMTLSAVV